MAGAGLSASGCLIIAGCSVGFHLTDMLAPQAEVEASPGSEPRAYSGRLSYAGLGLAGAGLAFKKLAEASKEDFPKASPGTFSGFPRPSRSFPKFSSTSCAQKPIGA